MTSLWPMPFLPLKTSVRTLNVPTTTSSGLNLALASTRSSRAALRVLRRLLILFRAAYFLCTVLCFPHTVVCFRSIILCLSRFLPKFQRAGGSSPNSPRCTTPTLVLTHTGPSLSSPFATTSTLSATVIRHSFRKQNFRVGKIRGGFYRCGAEHHRRLSRTRAFVRVREHGRCRTPLGAQTRVGRPQAQASPRSGSSHGEGCYHRTCESMRLYYHQVYMQTTILPYS